MVVGTPHSSSLGGHREAEQKGKEVTFSGKNTKQANRKHKKKTYQKRGEVTEVYQSETILLTTVTKGTIIIVSSLIPCGFSIN